MSYQNTIEKIYTALEFSQDEDKARAFGLSEKDGEMNVTLIGENEDVYELIENINNDKLQNINDHFAIVTYGWAAPLNSDGEVDGQPSKHPEKRRVRLMATVSRNNKNTMGSAVYFKDTQEVIYDMGDASGMLAEAIIELFEED